MTHPRTAIRAAVQALLLNNTIAQDRVYTNRPNPITQQASARAGRTEFPAILIYTTSESSTISNVAPREYQRTVEIIVECGKEISAATELDEQLDDFAREVENLLLVDDTLGGTAADLRMTGQSMGIVDQGQKVLGVVAITLEADYYEFFPGENLPAAPGDLVTVHTEYDMDGNGVADDAVAGDTITIGGPPLLLEDGGHLLTEDGGYITEES